MLTEAANPSLYIIAGPNGAGKTTFAREFLPEFAECGHFVNADLIAVGLSPFAPEAVAIQAGRLMLEGIRHLAQQRQDFSFETTLSGKSYMPMLREFQQEGYSIHLSYLWLNDVQLAVNRVAARLRDGGHSIPEDVVRRRFHRGLYHFVHDYGPLVNSWTLFDNSQGAVRMVAFTRASTLTILDQETYRQILEAVRP
jgi:predicted ABC-type ATPase